MTQPHQGAERQFSAFARPAGDPAAGVSGALVEVHERRAHCLVKVRVLSLREAMALHAELGEALRAFRLGAAMAAGEQDRPRAYLGPYPIRGKTLAEQENADVC